MKNYRWQKKTIHFILLLLLFVPLTSHLTPITCLYAAIPRVINYQGRLTNTSGAPLTGTYIITFRIYDAATAGTLLWEGVYPAVSVTKGIFSVALGEQNTPPYNFANLTFENACWLEIQVGTDLPMADRQKITASAYAFRAEKANSAEGQIRATGGLVIETRASDPASPVAGQMWLRTD